VHEKSSITEKAGLDIRVPLSTILRDDSAWTCFHEIASWALGGSKGLLTASMKADTGG
jgi:hypothetical protein